MAFVLPAQNERYIYIYIFLYCFTRKCKRDQKRGNNPGWFSAIFVALKYLCIYALKNETFKSQDLCLISGIN